MRCLLILATWFALIAASQAQTNAPAPALPAVPDPVALMRGSDIYRAWQAERDPKKRTDAAQQLVAAVIRSNDDQLAVIADEVARDGQPSRPLAPPAPGKVPLKPLTTLGGVAYSEVAWPATPVFRRVADNRLEAWTSTDGWLFDARGHLLTHVKVPRRDGDGREWFGAFLPDGTWITTDLWTEDKQINAFNAQGKWLWELDGAKILSQTAHSTPNNPDGEAPPTKPLICWARADRIGQGWLAAVGANGDFESVLVNRDGSFAALPAGETLWNLVYPRAMGVRGGYVNFAIASDDGRQTLSYAGVAHGPFALWPNISRSDGWGAVFHDATNRFGFWPKSHAIYLETNGGTWTAPHLVWFFDEAGRYVGEITSTYLGDAADGRSLLVLTPSNDVTKVKPGADGPILAQSRAFTWADGSRAMPFAIYDDLRLGFFKRGTGAAGQAAGAPSTPEIVLAKWPSSP